jgi:hypothetical protein
LKTLGKCKKNQPRRIASDNIGLVEAATSCLTRIFEFHKGVFQQLLALDYCLKTCKATKKNNYLNPLEQLGQLQPPQNLDPESPLSHLPHSHPERQLEP